MDPSELQNTSALYGHAKRVMKAVENAVSSLDDAFSFAAYLEELGRRHKSRSLKPVYLDVRRPQLSLNTNVINQPRPQGLHLVQNGGSEK